MAVNIDEITSLIVNAQKSAEVEKEVRKSLTRVENLISAVNTELQHIYQVFDGAVELKQRKPKASPQSDNGLKKDGTPKKKPGRPAKGVAEAHAA